MRTLMAKIKRADPISASEQRIKDVISEVIMNAVKPLLKLLIKLRVKANHISYFSATLGFISAILLWVDLRLSAYFLITSLLLDSLDGAFARYSETATVQGSITDCLTDQIVISSTTIGAILTGIVNPLLGCLYLLLYPIIIIFSVLRNILEIPSGYVLRPRIYFYIIFILYLFTGINWVNYLLALIVPILIIYVFRDFYRLRSCME